MEATEYIYVFKIADYYVIGAYIALLLSIGFVAKRFCSGVEDFFVGGRRMPWWLAGASVFMASFSAWTFTGAAGFAYKHGILMILLLTFTGFALFFAGTFIAHKCRQTRKFTAAQIIHSRFGRSAEQFFVWISVPNMLFGGAIWMMGLGTFLSVAFGIPITVTILVAGGIIMLYSTLSGTWAVAFSDFLQSLILLVLSVTIFTLTLIKTDGFSGLVSRLEPGHLSITSAEHSWFWIIAYFSQVFLIFNSIGGATRFLSVKDGGSARKAAYLAASLFMIGPIIWLTPPIAASFLFPDLETLLPGLNHSQDAAYAVMGLTLLPAGLAGLLVMVIFAATLSSMDTAINQNAGIITYNIYKPFLRPNANNRELFIVSRVANLFCGLFVTIAALLLSQQKEFALFDLMLILSSVVALPIAIPFFLMYWVRWTPPWSAVVSMLLGATWSFITFKLEMDFPLRVFGTITVGVLSFLSCGVFWKIISTDARAFVRSFYNTMDKAIDVATEVTGLSELGHLKVVGILAMVVGFGLFCVVLFPHPVFDRIVITCVSCVLMLFGYWMRRVC